MWDQMWASVGQHTYDIDTNTYQPDEALCEFVLEVIIDDRFWWSRTLVPYADLLDGDVVYKMVLDQMVLNVEARAKEHNETLPTPAKGGG